MGNHEDIQHLMQQLRTAVTGGAPAPAVLQILERLEPAVGELLGECESLRSRLERPLSGQHQRAEPGRLEAWVRKLERPETTAQ